MGSITEWIGGLKQGDVAAAQQLWERFYARLVILARAKLREFPRKVRDEEDLALSAFDQLCRSARSGRFPLLDDRNNLWNLLVDLTEKKVTSYKRWETRLKRKGAKNIFDAAAGNAGNECLPEIDSLVDKTLSPDFLAAFNDTFAHLLGRLQDENQRSIVVYRLEGFTNGEIAQLLNCPLRTVERKLSVIRRLWKKELDT